MCEIKVLFDGYSKQLDKDTTEANCTCTLIKGPKTIIVDTMTAWDRDRLTEALSRQNVDPASVDYVVCTHSHADHIGNNNLFTNAEHIVGFCVHRGTTFFERRFKNEKYCLCEGVSVVATPGHTAEDVTVLVQAEEGGRSYTYAITGDLFEKEEDIATPSLWRDVGTPELQDVQAQMRIRILDHADYIIPGHGAMFRVTDAMRQTVKSQTTSG